MNPEMEQGMVDALERIAKSLERLVKVCEIMGRAEIEEYNNEELLKRQGETNG